MKRSVQNMELPVSLVAITLALGLGLVEIEASASMSKSALNGRMSQVPEHIVSVTDAVASHARRLADPVRLGISAAKRFAYPDRSGPGHDGYPIRIVLAPSQARELITAAGNDAAGTPFQTVDESVIRVVAALPEKPDKTPADSGEAAATVSRGAHLAFDRNEFGRAFKGFSRTDRSLIHVMDVQYDLAGGKSAGMGLDIRKKLEANGAPKGEVALRIVNDSKILASTSDVARALGGDALSGISRLEDVAGGRDYVDFDDLRAAGIAVRYDPVRDRVVMTSERS